MAHRRCLSRQACACCAPLQCEHRPPSRRGLPVCGCVWRSNRRRHAGPCARPRRGGTATSSGATSDNSPHGLGAASCAQFRGGIWMGLDGRTAEHIVGTENGVYRASTIKPMPENERWNQCKVLAVVGAPWDPTPNVQDESGARTPRSRRAMKRWPTRGCTRCTSGRRILISMA